MNIEPKRYTVSEKITPLFVICSLQSVVARINAINFKNVYDNNYSMDDFNLINRSIVDLKNVQNAMFILNGKKGG